MTVEAVPPIPAITLDQLHKRYGDVVAVDNVSLTIEPGEFFTLLGPSGSGKTTVLRMIAGFEHATSGRVLLGGCDVTGTPPFDRDVNTVFQDYALFPHMSVQKNVEYGLMVKKVPRAERTKRAAEALEAVRLGDYSHRRPNQLSGGQRQRVALARALINRPKVLLLDEPLGALDLKLREEMQVELKNIQHEVGITFVFVTHDQDEALTMSDRIAVFDRGNIVQVGTPEQIYDHPATRFVAGFVGTSNVLSGIAAEAILGRSGTFVIRPEHFRVIKIGVDCAGPTERTVSGAVTHSQFVGSETRLRVRTEHVGELLVTVPHSHEHRPTFSSGQAIDLALSPAAASSVAD